MIPFLSFFFVLFLVWCCFIINKKNFIYIKNYKERNIFSFCCCFVVGAVLNKNVLVVVCILSKKVCTKSWTMNDMNVIMMKLKFCVLLNLYLFF